MKKRALIIIFFLIILYLTALVCILLSDGNSLRYLIWHAGTAGVFPDLAQTVAEAKGFHPYSNGMTIAIYPPLAYLICSVMAYCVPGVIDMGFCLSPNGILVISMFFLLTACAIVILLYESIKTNGWLRILLICAYMVSSPMIYEIERGNFVLLSVLFVLLFLLYYDSPSRYKRELALISLAIAAALKIYPAILGCLLLAEKRYKESVRCIVYGIIAFMVPFLFVGGGTALRQMVQGILWFQKETIQDTRNFGYAYKVNITNWVYAAGEYFKLDPSFVSRLNSLAVIVSGVVLLGLILRARKKWQKVTAALTFLILIPTFSWIYNVIYLIGAVPFFVNELVEKREITRIDMLYCILFIVIFAPLPYGEMLGSLHGAQRVSRDTFISSVALFLLIGTIVTDNILAFVHSEKKRRFV